MSTDDIPPTIGPLRNQRHERFAVLLNAGKTQADSYIQAGYTAANEKTLSVSASRLAAHPDIQRRLAELRDAQRVVLSKDWLIDQMIEVTAEARADRSQSAAIRALELLGREKNAFTERKDIVVRSFDQYTTEEIEAFLASERTQGIAPRNGGPGARRPAKAQGRDRKQKRA